MKKLFILFLLISLLCASHSTSFADTGNAVRVNVDMSPSDITAINVDGNVLVDINSLSKVFGYKVEGTLNTTYLYISTVCWIFHPNTRAVGIYDKGSDGRYVKDMDIYMSSDPKIINNILMVPLRFIVENFGGFVKWDGENNTVLVFTNETEKVRYEEINNKNSNPVQTEQYSTPTYSNTSESLIEVGTLVSMGGFYGTVEKVDGSRILVFWDSKSAFIPDKDIDFWALLAGIRYQSHNWVDKKALKVER